MTLTCLPDLARAGCADEAAGSFHRKAQEDADTQARNSGKSPLPEGAFFGNGKLDYGNGVNAHGLFSMDGTHQGGFKGDSPTGSYAGYTAGRQYKGPAGVNEDAMASFTSPTGWTALTVADGMGGYTGGSQASAMITDGMLRTLYSSRKTATGPDLRSVVVGGGTQMQNGYATFKDAGADQMGATVGCVGIYKNHLTVLRVGDARVVVYDGDGAIRFRTQDQSDFWENANLVIEKYALTKRISTDQALEAFEKSPSEVLAASEHQSIWEGIWNKNEKTTLPPRNIVTNALKLNHERFNDSKVGQGQSLDLDPGNWVVNAPDGLWDFVTHHEVGAILKSAKTPEDAVSAIYKKVQEVTAKNQLNPNKKIPDDDFSCIVYRHN